MTATTADAFRTYSTCVRIVHHAGTRCFAEIWNPELVPRTAFSPEDEVLSLPEVQDALAQAVREFEEWKNTL